MIEPADWVREARDKTVRITHAGMSERGGGNEREGGGDQANAHGFPLSASNVTAAKSHIGHALDKGVPRTSLTADFARVGPVSRTRRSAKRCAADPGSPQARTIGVCSASQRNQVYADCVNLSALLRCARDTPLQC